MKIFIGAFFTVCLISWQNTSFAVQGDLAISTETPTTLTARDYLRTQCAGNMVEISETIDTISRPISILGIENSVRRYVMGQDHAIYKMVPVFSRLKAGMTRPNKPRGSFLL